MGTQTDELADRLAIVDTITRLFVYTDQARWDDIVGTVFAATVDFDGGLGEPAGPRSSREIADGWKTGLAGLDAAARRDINAAKNIALAAGLAASACRGGARRAGATRARSPVKQEPRPVREGIPVL